MPYPHRVVNIPTGFKDLLEGVSKAVVKYQPESIPAFAAVFFNALLVFRDEKPGMPIHELMKEFRATKGSHFYRKKNKAVKPQVQPQVTVQGPERSPHPKPILEWEAGPLLMEARCEDVREPFSFISSDQPCSSRDIQAMDAVASTDGGQNECGLQVSATTITLSTGPIPADIAQGLALYRRKIDLESSPRDSPPLGASANNSCARVCSALFERVSFSEISQELDAVLIQTDVLPSESLIIVQTEHVPEMIVFQAHPLLAENAAVAPPPCDVPVRSKCSCASMVGALEDVMAPLEVDGTSQPSYPILASICERAAPVVERPAAMVAEPEESPALEVHSAPVEPQEMTPSRPSIPVGTLELPVSAPAVSDSPAMAVQEVQISVTDRPLAVILHSLSGATSPSETAEDVMLVPMVVSPPESVKKASRESSDFLCPLPAATLETESVSVICPPPSPVTVEIQPSILASPLTAATVETESSNRICPPSVVSVETELANMLSPSAAETVEADSSVVTCPHTAVTDDFVAPVSVCLPVVALEETGVPSVQLPAPAPALTEETLCQSASPCLPTVTAAGESRTPFLVYLPLPAPELAKTPGLLCQLGLGPEEAKSFPFLCLPISDIPRTPSLVTAGLAPAQTAAVAPAAAPDLPRTNLPGVTDIPRTLSYVAAGAQELPRLQSYAANTAEVQEPPRTPSYLANTPGVQEIPHNPSYLKNPAVFQDMCFMCPSVTASNLSRNNSFVHSPAAMAPQQLIRGPCMVSLYPQGGPVMGHCTHSPGQCPASLQQQAGMAPLNHGQQTNTNFMPICSQRPSLCSCLSRTGSHWRFCHLTRPESQGRVGGMICPYQNSQTMMHCNSLDHMANIPMYQDCGHYSSSCHLLPPCSQSSHGSLHTHHMEEPRCSAYNLGTSFVQPQPQTCSSDPLFHFPQQYHLVATPSQERQQALCPLQCPLLQQRHSSLLFCGHQGELSRLGCSSCVPATNQRQNQGGVEQKNNIPSCASLHDKRLDTSSNNNHGCVMNCNPQGN
ncbi:uncharacterized protein [Salmo salar]|uniref:RIIa domain-containing protein n=1 Tax=Salmo salar TaxID=8030 RepID=A0A1S3R3K8_SALSA|nr:uncharacterized protein LOC106599672 [Salmo salar]|eukprot:XP_014046437.1 PREDICTED: uncharacterized protein LOC106599672 [Salmo salar]